MSKQTKDGGEPPGYLGELSENQEQVLSEVKQWFMEDKGILNPWITNDSFFLRFCRARKFDPVEIKATLEKYLGYRDEYKIDTIIQVSEKFCFK